MAKMYKMDHAKRGIALAINIETYNPNPYELEERKWSGKDVENLKTTLKYLEFDLKFCENLKANEIKDKIQKIAELDHTNSDCFLSVVMSHGIDDKIVASDSEEISLKEIMQPIKTCQSLENKPKLFFFQACRGEKKMVDPCQPNSVVSNSNEQPPSDTTNITTTLDQSTKNDGESNIEQSIKIETESDLLVYYATLPEHYAYGTVAEGTYFIKSVCKELNEAYKNLPNNILLSAMILNINKRVRESGLALADPINRLIADVKFTPKEVSIDLKQ
jgi:caspase 7